MIVKDLIRFLDSIAPRVYQESYDNSGLLVGDENAEIDSALISLDVTEDVVQEAIDKKAGIIISHHPIIFGGLKSLTGKNYVERTVIKAIQNNIALYAIHTNLDNMSNGVNAKLASVLGLQDTRILSPKEGLLRKLCFYVPVSHTESVLESLFKAGAGKVGNYDQCSFRSQGTGTFRAQEGADPFVGELGIQHKEQEDRVEVVFPVDKTQGVLQALLSSHPYEEVAWDLLKLENSQETLGSGMVGTLPKPVSAMEFLNHLKDTVGGVVRYTKPISETVQKIAICGGSGSFLLRNAISAQADVFVTADFKYHQFFDAEEKIVIADIGHFESEQFTIELINDAVHEKFPNFATFQTAVKTNPILYL